MIIVKLSGGLGNQLFQYAIGRRLAIQHNTELVLDDSFYLHIPGGITPRKYELDNYPIKARRMNASERLNFQSYSNRFMKHLRRYINLPGKYAYKYENLNKFNESALSYSDNVFLDGYWQSEKYFLAAKSELKNELEPKAPMGAGDLLVAQKIQSCNSISIHIRRGDYAVLPSALNHHGLCSMEYYKTAIELISKKISDPVFFIFSDDLKWVKSNLNLRYPYFFVEHNSSENAFQDLRLMSLAQHHIIANSSFSWWSAWMGSAEGKIVIRPKYWLVNQLNANDWICPIDWISL